MLPCHTICLFFQQTNHNSTGKLMVKKYGCDKKAIEKSVFAYFQATFLRQILKNDMQSRHCNGIQWHKKCLMSDRRQAKLRKRKGNRNNFGNTLVSSTNTFFRLPNCPHFENGTNSLRKQFSGISKNYIQEEIFYTSKIAWLTRRLDNEVRSYVSRVE